jgi:phosphoribosylformimino-5-aminoimidazole carboxamide ribotide isomerase
VANVRLSQNDAADDIGADDSGERFSLSYQGKYLDDTVGVALGFSYLEQPNAFVFSRVGADSQLGYGDRDIDGSTVSIPRAFQWQGGNGTDERTGVLASFVFEPNDAIKAQLDYFNSDFDRGDQRQGITVGGIDQVDANTFVSGATVSNGVATSATISAIDPTLTNQDHPWFEARTEDQTTSAESESLGLNFEWYINDSSTLTFDVATSEGTKTREDRIASLHAYEFGDGGTTWQEAPGQAMTYALNGDGFASASFAGVDFTDLDQIRLGRYERYPHRYTDEIDSWQIDFEQDVEWGAVTSIAVGMRSSDRTFGMDRGTALYGSRSGQVTGWCEDNTSEIDCMPQSVDGFVRVQSLPGVPDHFVVTDLDALGASIFGAGGFEGKDIYSRDWTFLEDGQITEDVDAFYVMANLDFEWGNVPVRGNIGIRHVKTDVKSIGLQNVGGGNGDPITDDVGVTNDFLKFNSYGPDYSDTLPSVNLNFELSDNDVLRFAAASVIGRPPAGQLRGSAGSWFGPGTDYNVWTNGSPYLDPFRADQFDLSYEHYFEDGGAITAAVFWKDIESLLEKLQFPSGSVDFGALGIELPLNPDTGEQTTPGVYETWRNNDLGGYIRGIELAATNTFDDLPDFWSGLGVTASYSFTQSETEISGGSFYGQNLPLPGLSENVYSATVFYDYDRFATHMNIRYRDEFVQSLPVPGSSSPTLAQPYTTVDAQASYKFDNGFSVVFSVNNLTDEENKIEYGSPGLLGEYKQFGRQFYLGVNYQY